MYYYLQINYEKLPRKYPNSGYADADNYYFTIISLFLFNFNTKKLINKQQHPHLLAC
jgi:hypothetical protein